MLSFELSWSVGVRLNCKTTGLYQVIWMFECHCHQVAWIIIFGSRVVVYKLNFITWNTFTYSHISARDYCTIFAYILHSLHVRCLRMNISLCGCMQTYLKDLLYGFTLEVFYFSCLHGLCIHLNLKAWYVQLLGKYHLIFISVVSWCGPM